ncbi:MAG: glycosyltransferase, partial [Chloroflexi bacterium]|nr:glycosyltransferase [Chloroflexota bacterium]
RRPLVYTITSGLAANQPISSFFQRVSWVTVPDERSLACLRSAGILHSSVVRAGVDTSRFAHAPKPDEDEIRLLMGSAPWTEAQFRSKGVDALLDAVSREPRLHLVFLWRGVLTDAMMARVHRLGLQEQVTVLDRLVDVNQILAGVHAAIALADGPGIVKSYPHSLLDCLAAGKPVLVSRTIPMADYVMDTGCGEVVEEMTPAAILQAVERLLAEYPRRIEVAQAVGCRDFTQETMMEGYGQIYRALAGAT